MLMYVRRSSILYNKIRYKNKNKMKQISKESKKLIGERDKEIKQRNKKETTKIINERKNQNNRLLTRSGIMLLGSAKASYSLE
jgi:hypothetical protein